MPFYEYQCNACGHHHEEMQKVNDAPLRKCPACGRATLKKLVSAPIFRLKGAGWYETDFKSDKENRRNLAGDKDEVPPTSDAKGVDKSGDEGGDKSAEQPADKTAAATPETSTKPTANTPAGKTAPLPRAAKTTARSPARPRQRARAARPPA
ncbi:MAG: hypothetical protein NZM12_06605, partial [Steroidobacteraceae bacterium]|nr:hypothetical protein [Steroidobacteraceae bacterium]